MTASDFVCSFAMVVACHYLWCDNIRLADWIQRMAHKYTNAYWICTHSHTNTNTDTYFMDTCGKEEKKETWKLNARTLNAAIHGVPSMNSAEQHTLKANDVKGFCAVELKRLTLSHIIRSCHKIRHFRQTHANIRTSHKLKYFIKFFLLDIWMAHPE